MRPYTTNEHAPDKEARPSGSALPTPNERKMKTRIAYWSCQAAGWGMYAASGLSMATRQMGWRFHIAAGYVLFAPYNIALAGFVGGAMKRRGGLGGFSQGKLGALGGEGVVV